MIVEASSLPGARWPSPGEVELTLDLPLAGVLLGTDRSGTPVAVPAIRPVPSRFGVLGGTGPAMLFAHRLLAVGAHVTVSTRRVSAWQPLRTKAEDRRLSIVDGPARWPVQPPEAPGIGAGPQVFVADLPAPPPPWLGDAPWCTIVHVAQKVPSRSEFWRSLDAVLVTSPGHGRALAGLLHRPNIAQVNDLPPGQIALVDRNRTVPLTFMLAPAERDLVERKRP